ncbi:MAG: hypothetical protein R2940_17380 [Syntrophotaleaceae bacterium]
MRKVFISLATILLLGFTAHAEISREQMKGLDEQVQDIKTDVLGIAAELYQLEEKLLYPSDTQVAVFVSLVEGEELRVDSVEIRIGGKRVATHLYTFQELEALRKGGVQRIYTGNVTTGSHELQVILAGKTKGGSDLLRSETFTFSKEVGPKILEISLAGGELGFRDW